jgi:hypothetical protein
MILPAIEGERIDRLQAFHVNIALVVVLNSEILPNDDAVATLHQQRYRAASEIVHARSRVEIMRNISSHVSEIRKSNRSKPHRQRLNSAFIIWLPSLVVLELSSLTGVNNLSMRHRHDCLLVRPSHRVTTLSTSVPAGHRISSDHRRLLRAVPGCKSGTEEGLECA